MAENKVTIDAKGEMIGRVASRAASLLLGKNDPAFLKHVRKQKLVEIINAASVKFSGKKLQVKSYKRYSGYHSGLSKISVMKEFASSPGKVLTKTVWGMLPKNKSRKNIIKNLIVKD